jgi:large subunit ribosomal protein L18
MNRLQHTKVSQRLRAARVRSTVSGTSSRPRLSVRISNRHVEAQIIDDTAGKTLVASTTVGAKAATGNLTEKAAWLGGEIAKKAVKVKIKSVVMDRGARAYRQRLNAFATAARENGLEF